ncbi:tRNA pseudouridine synthase A [hydrothermal vent metagenome]|uniref:tRNA pseudouridine synthase A n=1 Tax=hydrothermal vent metagenome TaxID=652676 RepID=A0A1W1CB78_9ZZZZ
MRLKAILSYDGSSFFGFQKQKSTQNTIATAIEQALSSLNIDSSIVGSGRTDAGVHATGQVIHFDVPNYWHDKDRLQMELNRKLKKIHIKHISIVDDDFHARFWAKRRIYRYIFKTSGVSVFEEDYISHYNSFDIDILQNGLKLFEGEHDFKYFHKTGSPIHSTIRNIYRAYYRAYRDYHIIYFEANGFLRSQVRMMVDASMSCADGRVSLDLLQEQIDGKYRHTTSLAPPSGLYLARIVY